MWLKIGIPALFLLALVAVRVVYYLVWRKHWDKRPAANKPGKTQVIFVHDPDASIPPPVKDKP